MTLLFTAGGSRGKPPVVALLRQEAGGRRQESVGRRQKLGGRRQ
ncbi:hypothetical protein [Sphaerospermopsis sp. FACHB-1194]|nr:hypothetical protein [Sphaerospermopsis sp. FACHB-1194]